VLLDSRDAAQGALVEGRIDKPLSIDTLLPKSPERFPWAGHLGAKMVEPIVAEIEAATTTLVFTNTRSQAELWYQHILRLRPEWARVLAIHHGSLSRETRDWVEQGLKDGSLKAVVCTSSLDLGVDFLPVERVIQIGSPKGVARLLQRAGRSGHAPGRVSRITLAPTHTLELVEAAAVRDAVLRKKIESRRSLNAPLDVLAQHCVTVALGGGFRPDDLLAEVRETAAYEHLSDENWSWVLDFIRRGGPSLTAYPGFRRVAPDPKGVWRAADRYVVLRHKLNIGAIVSDASVMVQYGPAPRGAKLGAVEESFVARMKAGDKFWFAGRSLEFVRLRDQIAFVRAASGGGATPRWQGGRMPLSTTLADAMLDAFVRVGDDHYEEPELAAARPLIEVQRKWSTLPTPVNLLAETMKSREGWHLFLYPFAGRDIRLGLTSLIAWRAARERGCVFAQRQRLWVRDFERERARLGGNARVPDRARRKHRGADPGGRREPERRRIGASPLPRHCPYCGPRFARISRRTAHDERDAGLVRTLLRRVSQIRPSQWAPQTGRTRSARGRTRRAAAAGDASDDVGAPTRSPRLKTPNAFRLPIDGRPPARAAV
jgi:ATP-dependent helicase Lhr and Lhr-like helicase